MKARRFRHFHALVVRLIGMMRWESPDPVPFSISFLLEGKLSAFRDDDHRERAHGDIDVAGPIETCAGSRVKPADLNRIRRWARCRLRYALPAAA